MAYIPLVTYLFLPLAEELVKSSSFKKAVSRCADAAAVVPGDELDDRA